jgi:hypothetical protein
MPCRICEFFTDLGAGYFFFTYRLWGPGNETKNQLSEGRTKKNSCSVFASEALWILRDGDGEHAFGQTANS